MGFFFRINLIIQTTSSWSTNTMELSKMCTPSSKETTGLCRSFGSHYSGTGFLVSAFLLFAFGMNLSMCFGDVGCSPVYQVQVFSHPVWTAIWEFPAQGPWSVARVFCVLFFSTTDATAQTLSEIVSPKNEWISWMKPKNERDKCMSDKNDVLEIVAINFEPRVVFSVRIEASWYCPRDRAV